MAWSLGVHVIGIVFWVGGLLFLTKLLKFAAREGASPALAAFMSRAVHGLVLAGAALTLLSGFYQLFFNGMAYYMKQGWFHGKLTLIILLVALTLVVWRDIARIGRGEAVTAGRAGMLHGFVSALLVITVLLTFVGRSVGV